MPFQGQSLLDFNSYETTRSLTSNQDTTQTIAKRIREKHNVLNEILTSEKKYINDIRELVEGYYTEINSCYTDNPEFVYHIFANLSEIFEFTQAFYALLEVASSSRDESEIATCFILKHKYFLKLYSVYCQNYKIAHSTTERLERDTTIGKIIQRVRHKYGHSLRLATYLQLPVLRITKYHLLLQRYLKLLDWDSLAYARVLEALELMRQVNEQINRDMPDCEPLSRRKQEWQANESAALTTINLTALFGSVLKQGDLVLVDCPGNSHHIVVFQTMFLIRQSDASSKIINTITNDCLGFSPVTSNSGIKSWKKCFSVMDYNQNKNESICQYTFKTTSSEEKKSWQSAILSCMLNGYGKKISENIKKKVMRLDLDQSHSSKNPSIRTKITNFTRIKDLTKPVKSFDHDPNMTAPLPYKSPLLSMLRKKTDRLETSMNASLHKSENTLHNVLRRFYPGSRKKLNLTAGETSFSAMSELDMTLDQTLDATTINNTSVEVKLNDFEIIYQHLDTSYELLDSAIPISEFEKFRNKKIASSVAPDIDIKIIPITDSPRTETEVYESSLSSKSSINSEEGYYSNHDSSVSTLINEICSNSLSPVPLKQIDPLTHVHRRTHLISTPNPNLVMTSDSSSMKSENSSTITNSEIVHIEIINNFESLSSYDNESMSLFSNSVTEKVLESSRPKSPFRLENNEIVLDKKTQDLTSFNKMHKIRYKKRMLRQKQHIQQDNDEVTIFKPDIGLNIRFERFSRNLNTSIASLYENCQDITVKDVRDMNTRHGNFRVNSVSNMSAEVKSKSMNDLLAENEEEKLMNVKDLISRFERQKRPVCDD